jgi:hypothetical protein
MVVKLIDALETIMQGSVPFLEFKKLKEALPDEPKGIEPAALAKAILEVAPLRPDPNRDLKKTWHPSFALAFLKAVKRAETVPAQARAKLILRMLSPGDPQPEVNVNRLRRFALAMTKLSNNDGAPMLETAALFNATISAIWANAISDPAAEQNGPARFWGSVKEAASFEIATTHQGAWSHPNKLVTFCCTSPWRRRAPCPSCGLSSTSLRCRLIGR